MSLSTVLFLFLAHLGVGIVATLLAVSREAGVKFFRFNAGLAAVLIGVALAFRPSSGPGAVNIVAWSALVIWLASIRPAIVALACSSGVIVLVAQAIASAAGSAFDVKVLTIASFLSSAALL